MSNKNIHYQKNKLIDKIVTAVLYVIVFFIFTLLAALIIYILYKGISSFKPEYIGFGTNGLGVQLFNTVYLVFLTLLLSVPLGVASGIYLAEYAKDNIFTGIIRTCIETLSSLPSIVVGLFGFLVFVLLTHWSWTIMGGVLTLSALSIPLVTRVTEDAIREVPQSYRESSYALGSTKWQAIVNILLPSASSRILTGIILAAGRGFGEAAALMFTAGMSSDISFSNWNPLSHTSPLNIFRPADTLAVRIWYLKTSAIFDDKFLVANMAAATLIILVLVFNISSRLVGRALEKKMLGTK